MPKLDAVRARFARNEGLPFADVLTEANILDVLNEHGVTFRDRVFTPVTTIWGFLSQVLSEDHSCRDTVSRIIAHRAANGVPMCSPNTASYCNARSRIHTGVLSTLAKRTAEELHTSAGDQWKWNGRSVFIFDGSSVSMPDTPENQREYPQPPQQAEGLGFPLARIGVLLSLATGACHDLAIASYQGKGTGETNLFRRMYHTLTLGDVVLVDALFDDYFIACELCNLGVDLVAHAQYERRGSWTAESRPDGDLLAWQRPNKPRGMTGEQYRSYPKQLVMREVTGDARDKDNRVNQFKVVTTILDASIAGKQIGDLFERRWAGELYFRTFKQTFGCRKMRSHTPENAKLELDWSLLGLWCVCLLGQRELVENGTDPTWLSAASTIKAFQGTIREYRVRPETTEESLWMKLRLAVLDDYKRTSSKMSRNYPRKKQRQAIGPPIIAHASQQQITDAQRLKRQQREFRLTA